MTRISKDEWRWTALRSALIVLAATFPYLIGYLTTPPDLFYTGFLSNPEDGHSYLAKMRQGLNGSWSFHLPYTPDPHQGEFLFTFYLALGHIARWTRLPLIAVFHLARVISGAILLLILYYVIAHFFHDVSQRRFAFILVAIGSGLGWLALLLGEMTVDLWVPEGYVFYSLFANPHFPLAIGLMSLSILWSATPWGTSRPDWRRSIGVAVTTAGLGIVQPFGLLSVGAVLAVYALVLYLQKRRPPWREIACGAIIVLVGLPFVVNAYWATAENPAFANWSEQNQTPSPPPWDYAVGYGLILLLGLIGLWAGVRRRRDSDWLLIVWTTCTVALLYVPFSLQRRLVMGLIVPLGMLATGGWQVLSRRWRLRAPLSWAVAGLTHLFVIAITLVGALASSETLFLTRDEHAGLEWMAREVDSDALVIASPQTGLYIPAWAGQRVLYGHRYESVYADRRRDHLQTFFANGDLQLLEDTLPSRPQYIFYGPREQVIATGNWQPDPSWDTVFRQGSVAIYALPPE